MNCNTTHYRANSSSVPGDPTFTRQFAGALDRATAIITDTEYVRRELIGQLGVPAGKVTAVHLGVDPIFHPRPDDVLRPALAGLDLAPGAFALCVSTLEPRKMIAELITAWSRLPDELRRRFPLVLAGGSGWRNEAIHEHVNRGLAGGWLRYLGFVDEADLPSLYAGAALFVYPSIYEGFGLPPLEAMASGTPAIVADRSCLPEVCGDAALYVDPTDPNALVAALFSSLSDGGWRQDAARKGVERASLFTWQSCVEGTVGVYRRAIEAHGPRG